MKSPSPVPETSPLPVVAIVGRPNVGKSAIFNRIAGRRIAIVHERRGVTRDRLVCAAAWNGQPFQIVDTGGLPDVECARLQDPIEAGIRRQIDTALQDATVVIFVGDVESGVTPMDQEAAEVLRRSGRTALLAVNKCDHERRDAGAAEFERLGFSAFPVSALHNRGFAPLMEAVTFHLPSVAAPALAAPVRVVVVGRPNVGKSSYVNRLLNADRVIVSPLPGTTVDSVDIPFSIGEGDSARRYVLSDTPGLRAPRRIHDPVEYFSLLRAEQSIRGADVAILLLDAVEGPMEQDKKIAATILRHEKGCVLVVNKWDLAKGVSRREYERSLRNAVPFLHHVPVIFASALTGYRVEETVVAMDRVADRIRTRLPTGILNRVLLAASERVHPPAVAGRRLRVYYATQAGTAPIRILLFVNYPGCLTPAYKAYLVNTLREAFDLAGAAVALVPRERRESRPPPRSGRAPVKRGRKRAGR